MLGSFIFLSILHLQTNTGGILLHKCRIMKSEGWTRSASICVFHSTAENYGKCSLSVNKIIPAWLEGSMRSFSYLWWNSYMSVFCAGFFCYWTKYINHWRHTWFVSGFWELLCSIIKTSAPFEPSQHILMHNLYYSIYT